eukprot:COSAG01_NODE_3540_length_5957_cov_540.355241_8_plen_67_part_01
MRSVCAERRLAERAMLLTVELGRIINLDALLGEHHSERHIYCTMQLRTARSEDDPMELPSDGRDAKR